MAILEAPDDRLYSPHHLWVQMADDAPQTAWTGITHHLQEELPEILSIELPHAGDELEMGVACIHMHLDSGLYDLPAPLSGRAVVVNRDVLDRPDILHVDPYRHWIFKLEYDEPDELEMLLDAARYDRYLESL